MHCLTQNTKRILSNQIENNKQPNRNWAKKIVCSQKKKLKIANKHKRQTTRKVHRETEKIYAFFNPSVANLLKMHQSGIRGGHSLLLVGVKIDKINLSSKYSNFNYVYPSP